MDYISREVAIKELDTTYDNMVAMGARFYQGFSYARHIVNNVPAADVRKVVRGEWRKSELFNDHPECPVCSYVSSERSNFCPNCGADMRSKGGQDNGQADD